MLTAERLWDGTKLLDMPVVVIEDGRIASFSTRAAKEAPGDAQVIDFPGSTLGPALFDVHNQTLAKPVLGALYSYVAARWNHGRDGASKGTTRALPKVGQP